MNLFNKKKKNEKGFTLVELLVVIAIIGILAAVVTPNVFAQIEKGRVSSVVADYNALKTATLVYYADNGSKPAGIASITGNDYLDKAPTNPWSNNAQLTLATAAVTNAGIVTGDLYITLSNVPTSAIIRFKGEVDRIPNVVLTAQTTGIVRYDAITGNSGTIYLIVSPAN